MLCSLRWCHSNSCVKRFLLAACCWSRDLLFDLLTVTCLSFASKPDLTGLPIAYILHIHGLPCWRLYSRFFSVFIVTGETKKWTRKPRLPVDSWNSWSVSSRTGQFTDRITRRLHGRLANWWDIYSKCERISEWDDRSNAFLLKSQSANWPIANWFVREPSGSHLHQPEKPALVSVMCMFATVWG